MSKCGKAVCVRTVIPKFFYTGLRLTKSQKHNDKFNGNAHRATAFEEATLPVLKEMGDSVNLIGAESEVPLPFACNPNDYTWSVLSFKNRDKVLAEDCGFNHQLISVLTVNLKSKEKSRFTPKRKGNFCLCK